LNTIELNSDRRTELTANSSDQILETELPNPEFMIGSLSILKHQLSEVKKFGYPSLANRYATDLETLVENGLTIPEGPWDTIPKRPRPGLLAKEKLHGLNLDNQGRPVHPWLGAMATDPEIGVAAGLGEYYQYGPNKTADPIIFKNNHILLVRRNDTGHYAFPGGHVNKGEHDILAGIRETTEETTLAMRGILRPRIIYVGPVADVRMTAHAWPETTAMVFELEAEPLDKVQGKDDAKWAGWVPVDEALKLPLYGSHQILLSMAIQNRSRA
jgi:ADP-ribose pyrophosphatase YjhB (NUDIX family)